MEEEKYARLTLSNLLRLLYEDPQMHYLQFQCYQ